MTGHGFNMLYSRQSVPARTGTAFTRTTPKLSREERLYEIFVQCNLSIHSGKNSNPSTIELLGYDRLSIFYSFQHFFLPCRQLFLGCYVCLSNARHVSTTFSDLTVHLNFTKLLTRILSFEEVCVTERGETIPFPQKSKYLR